jgi:hypothetical protein
VAEAVHSSRLVRFGTFEVDLAAGELRKGGMKLKLTGLTMSQTSGSIWVLDNAGP